MTRPETINARPLFWTALALGLALRAIALIFGGTGAQEDGVTRLFAAIRWAEEPRWQGLSGIWPALPTYLLGALIRLWDRPLVWARLLSLTASLGAVFALRRGAARLWGAAVGDLAGAFLALHWYFILLVSAYWVEPIYLALVLAALERLTVLEANDSRAAALTAGALVALAWLCRHEAALVWLGALTWLSLAKKRRAGLLFSLPPGLVAAYHLGAPLLSGSSFFALIAEQSAMRSREVALLERSRWRGLWSWILLPAAIPSFLVLTPALIGLQQKKKAALKDLFVLNALAQLAPFFALTLAVAWLPKLRYLTLYLVGAFPLCALGWLVLARRTRRPRLTLALGLAAAVVVQAFAWSQARAAREQPLAFLPVDWPARSQPFLEARLRAVPARRERALVVSLGEGPSHDPWGLTGALVGSSELRRALRPRLIGSYGPALTAAAIPPEVWSATLIVIDPAGPLYALCRDEKARLAPGYRVERLSSRLEVWSPGQ